MSESFTVEIDEELEELIPGYLENRRKDVITLREGIANGDVEIVKRIGHQIKGNAGSYGFTKMSTFGKEIEDLCKDGHIEKTSEYVDKIEKYLDGVKVVFVNMD